MKSRFIQTRFWDDDKVLSLSKNARYLYIYLLTCSYINICGAFQLADVKIQFETGISAEELRDAQYEIVKVGKVKFYEGWVYVVNARKNNNFEKYEGNFKAMLKEIAKIPEGVKENFDIKINTPPTLVSHYSDNSVTLPRNKKQEISNKKETVKFGVDFSPEVSKVVDHYKEVFHLSYVQKLLENSTAAGHLIANYGLDKVMVMIEEAKRTKGQKFYPQIGNLMDLLEKWEKLDYMLARDRKDEPKKEDLSVKTSIGKEVKNGNQ